MTATPYQDGWRDAVNYMRHKVQVRSLESLAAWGKRQGEYLYGAKPLWEELTAAYSDISNYLSRVNLEPPPEPSPWRPMEEASKDNAVLVWCKFEGFKGQCWWDETTSNWRDIVGNGVRKPTHFKLPPPGPEEGE